jgi:bud site selection protein 20
MGTGSQHTKRGKGGANRHFKRTIMDPKRRGRDIDRIQDDLAKLAAGKDLGVADVDAPGGGLHYCAACARHFTNDANLETHKRTKPHKKRLRVVSEPQYTQREADAGAGKSASA